MGKYLRIPLVLLVALAVLLVLALPALADREGGEGRGSGRSFAASYEAEDEAYEHGGGQAAPSAPAPPMPSPLETAALEGIISQANLRGNPQLALPAAVANLVRNPMSPEALAYVRGLAAAAGPGAPRLWVDGRPLGAAPAGDATHVLVPLSPVAQALQVSVTVQGNGQYVLSRGGRQAQLTAGSTAASVGGAPLTLDQPPVQQSSELYVSLRTLADILGTQVLYDTASGLIIVSAAGG